MGLSNTWTSIGSKEENRERTNMMESKKVGCVAPAAPTAIVYERVVCSCVEWGRILMQSRDEENTKR